MKCRAIRRKKLSFKILDVSRDDISTADTDTASSSERRPLSTSGARKHSLSSPRRKGVRFTEQVSPVCSLKKNGGLIQINLLVDWILIDIIANNIHKLPISYYWYFDNQIITYKPQLQIQRNDCKKFFGKACITAFYAINIFI